MRRRESLFAAIGPLHGIFIRQVEPDRWVGDGDSDWQASNFENSGGVVASRLPTGSARVGRNAESAKANTDGDWRRTGLGVLKCRRRVEAEQGGRYVLYNEW